MPIELSNVMIWNSDAKKRDRIGFKQDGDKKTRVFKSTGKEIK